MTPQEAFAHAQTGFQAYRAGRFSDGEAVANQILLLLPTDPNGLYLKGISRRALADPEQALTYLTRADAAAPGQFGFELAIIQVLTDLGRYDDARTWFAALEKAHPNAKHIDYHGGQLEQRAGALGPARTYYEKALKATPHELMILRGLAWICENQRDWDAAIDYADQVLAIRPGDPIGLSARCGADFAAGNHIAARDRIDVHFDPAESNPAESLSVYRRLGDACEAIGDYEAAFTAYETGNNAYRESMAPGGRFIDERHGLASVERLRDAYAGWSSENVDAGPDQDPAPVFLVGFPRSGTTLLEQILRAHPQIETSDEKPLLDPILDAAGDTTESLDGFLTRLPDAVAGLRDAYRKGVSASGSGAAGMFVDKLPLNLVWLGVIGRVFPNARIILALRDPRDAVFSCWQRVFKANSAMLRMLTLADTASYYDAAMAAGEAARTACPGLEITEVRYEDLVADTAGEARRVIEALGVEWDDEVLNYREQLSDDISTPSASQVAKPIYKSSVGKWRRYAAHLDAVMPVLSPWVERWGYTDD
jgi:tetratricopeptide (TPR) repeat protein